MTKISKLEAYLKSGASATPKQITSMFGLQNYTAAIYTLRKRGVCVYKSHATLSTGERTVKYKIGKPTPKMVALAHRMGMLNGTIALV